MSFFFVKEFSVHHFIPTGFGVGGRFFRADFLSFKDSYTLSLLRSRSRSRLLVRIACFGRDSWISKMGWIGAVAYTSFGGGAVYCMHCIFGGSMRIFQDG